MNFLTAITRENDVIVRKQLMLLISRLGEWPLANEFWNEKKGYTWTKLFYKMFEEGLGQAGPFRFQLVVDGENNSKQAMLQVRRKNPLKVHKLIRLLPRRMIKVR